MWIKIMVYHYKKNPSNFLKKDFYIFKSLILLIKMGLFFEFSVFVFEFINSTRCINQFHFTRVIRM